jgi:hypothetical protein
MKYRIESEALEKIFQSWFEKTYPGVPTYTIQHIDRINLFYGPGKEFENFVWQQGGHIRKENKRRYAEFFEDRDLTMFLLRWT